MTRTRTAVVIDDDLDQGEAIAGQLKHAGFAVSIARTGTDALAFVNEHSPDVVTLDLGLPDLEGVEVCRQIRRFSDCYIIIVSARSAEIDRLVGLEVGADDYLVKPFSIRELHARIDTLLRRPRVPGLREPHQPAQEVAPVAVIGCEHLGLDLHARVVHAGGEDVKLTRIEFDLLAYLVARPRTVVSREELLRSIWATEYIPHSTHLVNVHLGNLRHKLRTPAGDSQWIHTVRGVGFRFDDPCFAGPPASRHPSVRSLEGAATAHA